MSDLRATLRTAVEIASQRGKLLSQIKSALDSGDDQAALALMREYVGITADEKSSNRTNPRFN